VKKKLLLLPILFLIIVFVFIKINTHYWNGKDKLGFAYTKSNGDVGVEILDPKLNEITTITIPGETEVDVARNYGTLRLKNVWQLSQNEKLNGALLPETILQNFLFPITLWNDTKSTNIPIGDRLMIWLFTIKVHDLDKTEIDMGKSQYLHKEKLNDGQVGYRLLGNISERLGVYFLDNEIASKNLKVHIIDANGKTANSLIVGQILEVLGGKIVSVDRKQDLGDYDCQVLGTDKNINKKIASLFSCLVLDEKTSFDLEIRLGGKFAKRF
jgi:hypothetical protein